MDKGYITPEDLRLGPVLKQEIAEVFAGELKSRVMVQWDSNLLEFLMHQLEMLSESKCATTLDPSKISDLTNAHPSVMMDSLWQSRGRMSR
ncbi:hypothetical protein C817_05588 [Dorea sp. 5-2]|nr:hypothetical protein C817_05588 [Dorea sp. 5-2]